MKIDRQRIYEKYGGHCAYCGKKIKFKEMQVDHIAPKSLSHFEQHIEKTVKKYPDIEFYADCITMKNGVDDLLNLNPSCRRCNHYKRADTLGAFRLAIKTLHDRIRKIYICKVAEDFGIIEIKEWDGEFYFEKCDCATQ